MQTFCKRFGTETQAAVQTRVAAGDTNVFYVPTEGWLVSADYTDGTHPTDAGHVKVADKLTPIIAAKL
jgi:lysophospholipase L1-like esterase